jgi:PAS domain S-box-containing protein
VPIVNDSKEVVSVMSISTNITAQRNMEKELRESEWRYRALFENSTEAIVVLDQDTKRFVDANDQATEFLGYSREELLQMSVPDIHPKDKLNEIMEIFNKFSAGKEVLAREIPIQHKDGSIKYVDISRGHVTVEGKSLLAGYFRDVTSQKKAKEELQQNQQHLENLDRINRCMAQASTVKDMLWAMANELLSIFDTDRAWLLFPCDPDAAFWRVPVETVNPKYPGAFSEDIDYPMDDSARSVLSGALDSDGPVTYEFSLDSKEAPEFARRFNIHSQIVTVLRVRVGKPWLLGMHQCSHKRQWTQHEKKLFQDIAERVTDALATLVTLKQLEDDVAERKKAEEALRVSEGKTKQLLSDNRKLTQRFFNVQEQEQKNLARELHDEFGQWLMAISLNSQALTQNIDANKPDLVEAASAIKLSVDQLYKGIRTMLRQLRPTSLEDVGLVEGLRELIAMWSSNNPHVHCNYEAKGKLENLNDEFNISIYRIIQEGLTNIAKHANARNVTISVIRDSHAGKLADNIQICIDDDGVGLGKHVSDEGLGLPGMRERVLVLGGEFNINSREKKGARIQIRIPMNTSQ